MIRLWENYGTLPAGRFLLSRAAPTSRILGGGLRRLIAGDAQGDERMQTAPFEPTALAIAVSARKHPCGYL